MLFSEVKNNESEWKGALVRQREPSHLHWSSSEINITVCGSWDVVKWKVTHGHVGSHEEGPICVYMYGAFIVTNKMQIWGFGIMANNTFTWSYMTLQSSQHSLAHATRKSYDLSAVGNQAIWNDVPDEIIIHCLQTPLEGSLVLANFLIKFLCLIPACTQQHHLVKFTSTSFTLTVLA